jgi:hypothetical protein
MKNKIIIIALLLQLCVSAQPVINFSDLNFNASGTVYSANPVGIIAGSSGANQTWDYSAIALTTIGTGSSTVVATAPFASNFPQANYFVKSTTNGTSYYIIAKITTTTKLETLALVTDTSILVNFTPNPQTQFEFPLTYNQTITDSYALLVTPTVNTTFTIKYDGYGTLITPFGTYNNVVRLKKLDGIFPVFSWYTLNPLKQIVNIQFGSGGVTSASFYEYPNLQVTQNEVQKSLLLYPNPTSDYFTISKQNNTTFEYKIFDLVGKIVKNDKAKSNEKIDIEHLKYGSYIVQIIDEEGNISKQKLFKN